MHLIQKIKQRSIARNAMILLFAITLGSAAVTDALAAGRGGASGFGGGHIGRFGAPLLSAPSMPPPIFNPSSPYKVAPSGEIPVSPASPGSVFGNG